MLVLTVNFKIWFKKGILKNHAQLFCLWGFRIVWLFKKECQGNNKFAILELARMQPQLWDFYVHKRTLQKLCHWAYMPSILLNFSCKVVMWFLCQIFLCCICYFQSIQLCEILRETLHFFLPSNPCVPVSPQYLHTWDNFPSWYPLHISW